MNIQWFPGHMTKARRQMVEQAALVDMVCEIVDARIPRSSRNPDIDELFGCLPRLMILNRIDQADAEQTKAWARHFRGEGAAVLQTDSQSGRGCSQFAAVVREKLAPLLQFRAEKGQVGKPLRVMVVGIPNVGKSSFINRVARRRAAIAADKPGVTRGRQWITVEKGLEMLDTPGILWPRFDSQTVGENLAFTGAVRDAILDRETLAANLMLRLSAIYPERIMERYKINPANIADDTGFVLLEQAARKRGFLIRGGEVDIDRMATILLDEFRGGKLGQITLESPVENPHG